MFVSRAAPEVLQHGQYSPASDVYCFGMLAWWVFNAFDHSIAGDVETPDSLSPLDSVPMKEVCVLHVAAYLAFVMEFTDAEAEGVLGQTFVSQCFAQLESPDSSQVQCCTVCFLVRQRNCAYCLVPWIMMKCKFGPCDFVGIYLVCNHRRARESFPLAKLRDILHCKNTKRWHPVLGIGSTALADAVTLSR